EQLSKLQIETQLAADRRLEEARRKHAGLAADSNAWPLLLELADRYERLLEQSRELARRREAVPDAVATLVARIQLGAQREASEVALPEHEFERDIQTGLESQKQAQRRIDESLADVAVQIQRSKDQLAQLSGEENALAPLAEAKAGGRWWRLAWWRASFRG